MKPGDFILDGVNSSDHGVIIQGRPTIDTPNRRVEFKQSFGMSGELPYDEESYENTEMKLNLIVKGTATRSASANREFVQDWFDSGRYMDFIPYFDQDKIYHVMATEAPSFMTKYFLEEHQIVSLKLTVLPYKHYVQSPKVTRTTSGTITNPHLKPSKPLLKVIGSGDITLNVNGIPFLLKGVAGHIYLDSELSFAYENNDGLLTNANNKVRTLDYPTIKPGSNTISWTGAVTSVEIEPRWRTLA